jgi:TRAP-type C4-dicarboxylate transport system permease small subunit
MILGVQSFSLRISIKEMMKIILNLLFAAFFIGMLYLSYIYLTRYWVDPDAGTYELYKKEHRDL